MPASRVRATTPWFVQHILNPIFLRTGTLPILAVRGRRSGKLIRTPINVLEMNGAHYLTSPRGETGWSRNLRESGECWLKLNGHEQHYRASEIPPAERGQIIAAYLDKWGNQTRAQFEKLPDPVDHPTFRLEDIDGSGAAGVGG
jgi:deazaflavin-dependent oxidoreductase (nitroreductase family)